MKNTPLFIYIIFSFLLCISCTKEQYKTDNKNKMTKKESYASDYLAKQAVELTQENMKNRETNEKAAIKRNSKEQERLNNLNEKSSKVKKSKKHSGNFAIY
jgi:hypothetical protein